MDKRMTKHLKEFFTYKKELVTFSSFPDDFKFKNIISFDDIQVDFQLSFNKYKIPKLENDSTLQYLQKIFKWILENLKHDGYTKYRGKLYGNQILKYVIDEGKGINCLMHAIILQEIFYQQGVYAHIVQGNPSDYRIGDCHWLVNLYNREYQKWMLVDPVWLGFYVNEDNIPLDFFEIREYLVTGKKIIPNKEIKVGYYEYLLCRYLFFFGFFEKNGLGTFEIKNQQKYYLAPEGFNSKKYIESKEKERFLPFDIKEYLYFSRFEEKSIHL